MARTCDPTPMTHPTPGTCLAVGGFRRKHRLGSAMSAVLLFMCCGSLLAVVTMTAQPKFLFADAKAPTPSIAAHPQNQRIIEALATLIGSSVEVMAVHQRGPTPYFEIVLWMEDTRNPGQIDPEEVAVLCHSEILWTITYYRLEGSMSPDEYLQSDSFFWCREGLSQPAFCNWWRTQSMVEPKVIAVGISDLHCEQMEEGDNNTSLLRISLTWAADSTDGPDEASVFVDVLLSPEGAQGVSADA